MKDQASPSTPIRAILALVGAVLGFVVTVAVGAMILYVLSLIWQALFGVSRMRRAPLGAALAVFLVPLAGTVWGAAIGWNLHQYQFGDRVRTFLDARTMIDRAWMAWAIVWTAALGLIVPTFGAFWRGSRYWYLDNDGIATLLWWLLPIIGGFIVSRLVAWVMKGSR
jgi:hypothetical protein